MQKISDMINNMVNESLEKLYTEVDIDTVRNKTPLIMDQKTKDKLILLANNNKDKLVNLIKFNYNVAFVGHKYQIEISQCNDEWFKGIVLMLGLDRDLDSDDDYRYTYYMCDTYDGVLQLLSDFMNIN